MNMQNRFQRGRQLDDLRSNTREDVPRMEDLVQIAQFPADKYAHIRLFPDVFTYGGHWVTVKKRDGSKGSFYAGCSAFDPETGNRAGGNGKDHCPWCAYEADQRELGAGKNGVPPSKSGFRPYNYMNIIVRSIQKGGDTTRARKTALEAETGFKELDSEAWTPVRVLKAGTGLIKELREIRELNLHETDEGMVAFPVSDIQYGCDVLLKYSPKAASPNDVWKASRGEPTPLTDKEMNYLIWDLKDRIPTTSYETALAEFNSWASRNDVSQSGEGEPAAPARGRQASRHPDPDEMDGELPVAQQRRAAAPRRQEPAPVEQGFEEGGDEFGGGDDDGFNAPPPAPRGRQAAPVAQARGRVAPARQPDPDDGFGDPEGGDDFVEPPPPPRGRQAAPAATPARGRQAAPARQAAPPDGFDDGGEPDGFDGGEDFADPPPPPRRQAAPAAQAQRGRQAAPARPAPQAPQYDDGFGDDPEAGGDDFNDPPPPPAPARRPAVGRR